MSAAPDLLNVSDHDVDYFSYHGRRMKIKITSVYDGDTFTACFWDGGELRKYKFRCNGYDSEELRQSRSRVDRDVAKQRALADREYFINLIDDYTHGTRVIDVNMGSFDKYGRILVDLPVDGSINRAMITSNHGTTYNGGHKPSPPTAADDNK